MLLSHVEAEFLHTEDIATIQAAVRDNLEGSDLIYLNY
jgi:hypothetical protein